LERKLSYKGGDLDKKSSYDGSFDKINQDYYFIIMGYSHRSNEDILILIENWNILIDEVADIIINNNFFHPSHSKIQKMAEISSS